MIRADHASPLGVLTLASDGAGLTALVFENHAKRIRAVEEARPGEDGVIAAARRELDAYFAGRALTFSVPLAPRGTPFQQSVWALLRALAPGQTTTYAALARLLGKPKAVRAVGGAVGRNPISIIVPCHRVLGAAGALTGFAGGVARKRFLLDHEHARAAA
jgi:methylated-DNA-[protein]-cysteine S-methyltransferase